MGFKNEKKEILKRLDSGDYQHETRAEIDKKNYLQTGQITLENVMKIINKASGVNYSTSPHHVVNGVNVHVLKKINFENKDWYIKWYYLEPDLFFISVHD